MKSYAIAVIPGDGVGPSIIKDGARIIEAAADNFKIEWVSYPYSASNYVKKKTALPKRGLEEICCLDAIYMGPLGHPSVGLGFIERHFYRPLRHVFDQSIFLMPVEKYGGADSKVPDKKTDFFIIRENTEDFYRGIGGTFWKYRPGEMAVQAGIISRNSCKRVMNYAFSFAKRKKRKLITSSDKADVMPHAYNLWREVLLEISKNHKKIKTEFELVDNTIQSMITNPSHYQVIVAPNMFGHFLSRLSFLLIGGEGMAYSAEINPKGISTFKPSLSYASQTEKRANPIGSILAGALMLEELGQKRASTRIVKAVRSVLKEGKHRTPDMGGTSSTRKVTNQIERRLLK